MIVEVDELELRLLTQVMRCGCGVHRAHILVCPEGNKCNVGVSLSFRELSPVGSSVCW